MPGYDVTLHRFTPLERFDGISYTKAVIEEAPAAGGPWTVIDEVALDADPDPKHPAPRDLTTSHATLEQGFYRVIWKDDFGGQSAPSAAVQRRLPVGVRPAIADVASMLRARTKILGGAEAGTFTQATRPTDDQVEDLITFAEDEVLGKVQPASAGSLYETRVRGAIVLYTAILVETSFFPEQVGSAKSPAGVYEKLYDSRIMALIAEGETGEPEGMGDKDAPADPYWSFPAIAGDWVGRW